MSTVARRTLGLAALAASVVAGVVIVTSPEPRGGIPGPAPAPADAQPVVVTEVISGDRLSVRVDAPGSQWQTWGSLTVRLAGVEVGAFTEACHAEVAQQHLAALAPPGSVVWVTQAGPRDADGTWPVSLWSTRNRLVAATLAELGDVRPVADELPTAYVGLITQAAESALERAAGQWGGCP